MMTFLLPAVVRSNLAVAVKALDANDVDSFIELAVNMLGLSQDTAISRVRSLISEHGDKTVQQVWDEGLIQKLSEPLIQGAQVALEEISLNADVFASCEHCELDFAISARDHYTRGDGKETGAFCPHCSKFTSTT